MPPALETIGATGYENESKYRPGRCTGLLSNRPFSKMAAENSNKSKFKKSIPALERVSAFRV